MATTLRGYDPGATATIAGVLFEIHHRRDDSTHVVSVLGDLDLASLPRLSEGLNGLAESAEVTLDLGGVDYLDPLCLGALLAAELRIRRAGGSFAILAGGEVHALLCETRLDRILDVQTVLSR